MAQVNCYLPNDLKAEAEAELGAGVNFSKLLRQGVIAELRAHRAGSTGEEAAASEAEPVGGGSAG